MRGVWIRGLLSLLAVFAGAGSVHAIDIIGVIPPGSDGNDIAMELESGWNVGDYSCGTTVDGSIVTLEVIETAGGPCANQKVTLTFAVPGGVLAVARPYRYRVECSTFAGPGSGNPNMINHSLGFDDPLVPIDEGTFTFELFDPPEQIVVNTTHAFLAAGTIPTLGTWMTLLLGGGLLGLGVFTIHRRG